MSTLTLAEQPPSGTLGAGFEPAHHQELFELADYAWRAGDLGDARDILHGLLTLERTHSPSWELLGLVERAAGRLDDARAALARALSDEPRNVAAGVALVEVLGELHADDEARGMASYLAARRVLGPALGERLQAAVAALPGMRP